MRSFIFRLISLFTIILIYPFKFVNVLFSGMNFLGIFSPSMDLRSSFISSWKNSMLSHNRGILFSEAHRHMRRHKRSPADHTMRRIGKASQLIIEKFHYDWEYFPSNYTEKDVIKFDLYRNLSISNYSSTFTPFMSPSFRSINSSYHCPSRPCVSTILANGIAHFMIGFYRSMSRTCVHTHTYA
jgi:hypothetical protein